MTTFLIAAALLVVATLAMLLRPWRRGGAAGRTAATTREINAALCRDQWLELDRDRAAGTLTEADHAQARAELQRRLLDDVGVGAFGVEASGVDAGTGADAATAAAGGSEAAAARRGARTTAWLITLAVPLLAGSIYALIGHPAALDERARQGAGHGDVEKAVEALAARLQTSPDAKGFATLARSYRVMGRLQDAQAAFARIGPDLDRDAGLLAEYADTLASNAQGRLDGKPLELVTRALAIEPNHPMALALAATAAFNRNDLATAARHWERLLPLLPPDSDDTRWVESQLVEIRGTVGRVDPSGAGNGSVGGSASPAVAAVATVAAASAAAGDPGSIRGRVSLAPALASDVLPTDTVFVFARAVNGSRMPLALQRARVADLPLEFTLDDSSAMVPASKLSGATEVRIEARVSRSGSASPGSGDLIGVGPVARPGVRGLTFEINQRRP
jgi:cytochrome c-type biogenesis protein CcmH